MAKKSFEIQGAKLRLGGLDLEAGSTSVVIPGVTQATTYFVEEIEDTDVDQTISFIISPIVIDTPTYNDYNNNGVSTGRAEYSCGLDDDGYIDKVELFGGGGTYSINDTTDADMWAYVGLEPDPFAPFSPEYWVEVPFRPVFRADTVDNTITSTYKFENGVFGTKDNANTGGWGDYNMYLDPGGESNAGIEIPRVDTQTSGSPLIIYNNQNANNDIQLSVHSGAFLFTGDGSLTFPDNTVQTTAFTGDELFGAGIAQVGSTQTIVDDGSGGLVGWNQQALSIAYDPNVISTYPVGSTITWQDGTTATITQWDDYGPTYIDLFWDTPKTGTLFPITLKTSNYVAASPATARISVTPTSVGANTQYWIFDEDGNLTFPDATIQTTAWAGGSVVFAPNTSIGDSTDVEGRIAFDSTYFYYCTANYNGADNIWKRVAWSMDTW